MWQCHTNWPGLSNRAFTRVTWPGYAMTVSLTPDSQSSGGVTAVGQERDATVALLRRGWELLPVVGDFPSPFLFHFDFTDTQTGAVVLTSERRRALRDRYDVTVPGGVLDGRVAAAMAVALDALQSR